MPQIDRRDLTREVPLSSAKQIVDSFCKDLVTYPNEDVYLKRGVCRDLAEEYCPLVCLAQELWGVIGIRLFPASNQGPDGEIRFWWRHPFIVQITCAHEGYQMRLIREQLLAGEIVFPKQKRSRNRSTGQIEASGRVLTTPASEVQVRFERIQERILAKENNYYSDTNTLLIVEVPAKFKHLEGLHPKLCTAVRDGLGSPYRRIYVN